MIPAAFDYAAPRTLEDAVNLVARYEDEGKILAGGHSLIPLMKLRLAAPRVLIDLARIPDLSYIRDRGDYVSIGAMSTYVSLQSSPWLQERVPLLSDASAMVGDMQVRNRGTIGGSCAHADPASDMPAVLVALDARIVALGRTGERVIAARDFFRDIWTSALTSDEIVTEVQVPYPRDPGSRAYIKFRQRAADWAIVGVAVSVDRLDSTIQRSSVVLTNVGPTPMRATTVENALQGQLATRELVDSAAAQASAELQPSDELRGSGEYKSHLARVLTRRALLQALQIAH